MIIMNFLMRIIGFAYDVFLSNLLGAEAMGLFQIAMSTLMTFLILTISGIPTSFTKVIAEENSKNGYRNVEGIFKITMAFNLFLSVLLSGVLLYFSEFIAINMLKNKDMIIGVYLMVPAIIIHSLSNVFKAYFYGMKNMVFPSIAQVIEHLSRFLVIVSLLCYLGPKDPIIGAIIAVLGISIGEFFDLLWSYFSRKYLYKKPSYHPPTKGKSLPYLMRILTMAIPLTIAGSFGVILRFTNSILIPNRLVVAGYTNQEAIATFGRIMGMTMPLISLTFIVTSALVTNLIPNLSEQIARKRYRDIRRNIHLSLKATILVSFPLTALYTVFSKPLAIFLYKDPLVAPYIFIMGFATILMAIQHVITGVLLGLNKQINDTINGIIGMIIRVILIYLLVGNPRFGINGFFIAFYVSMIIIILLDLISLRSVIKLNLDYKDLFGKPLFASVFMLGAIYLSIYDFDHIENITSLNFIMSLVVGGFAYILILIVTKAIPKNFLIRLFKSN